MLTVLVSALNCQVLVLVLSRHKARSLGPGLNADNLGLSLVLEEASLNYTPE
jgi:hypothetical protein